MAAERLLNGCWTGLIDATNKVSLSSRCPSFATFHPTRLITQKFGLGGPRCAVVYGARILVPARSYKGGYMSGLLASPHRTFETYVQIRIEFSKTVLYTDLNTLYAPPIWLYTPPPYFYSIFGHPTTKARRSGVKSK